ncbi:MAG: SAM-dependent chlorinase/fluorinase [Ginsengibacter sp.]
MALITLTSDIGRQDFLTGAVKGQLLQINPGFNIVDISHELSPFNYPQAAYVCRNAIRNFPAETFHIVLVNLFDKNKNHLLLIQHNDQYIGCADNGLITMILEETPEKIVAIPWDNSIQKNTLNCAKVFAKAYQNLLNGIAFKECGDPEVSIEVKNPLRALRGEKYIEGQIIFIDNFENVIINITKEEFEEQRRGRSFKIVFKRDEIIEKISETYADVHESEKLALFNSANYLEIAINKGNAAGLFGLEGYTEKINMQTQYMQNRLLYQTVKIYFD